MICIFYTFLQFSYKYLFFIAGQNIQSSNVGHFGFYAVILRQIIKHLG